MVDRGRGCNSRARRRFRSKASACPDSHNVKAVGRVDRRLAAIDRFKAGDLKLVSRGLAFVRRLLCCLLNLRAAQEAFFTEQDDGDRPEKESDIREQ